MQKVSKSTFVISVVIICTAMLAGMNINVSLPITIFTILVGSLLVFTKTSFYTGMPKGQSFYLSISLIIFATHNTIIFIFNLLLNSEIQSEATLQRMSSIAQRNILILCILLTWILALQIYSKNKWLDTRFALIIFAANAIPIALPVSFTSVKLSYLINSFIPMILILVLINGINSKYSFKDGLYFKDIKPIFFIVTISIVIGIFLQATSWSYFDFERNQATKGFGLLNGLPRNWWFEFNNNSYLRFCGTLEDPILMSYLTSTLAIVALVYKKWIYFFIFSVACLATLGKGAILLLIIITMLKLTRLKLNSNLKVILLMLGVAMLYIVNILGMLGPETSADVHALGLTLPFINIPNISSFEIFFGHGVGSGGNILKAYLQSDIDYHTWLSTGSESGIGTIFYQTGFVGLLSFIYCCIKSSNKLKSQDSKVFFAIYFLNLFLQENLINFNYLFLLLIAIYTLELRLRRNQREV